MRNTAALLALFVAGCADRSDTLHPITPDDAKSAVITFVHDNPAEFVGDPDPTMLKSLDLVDIGNDTWMFGAFTIHPNARSYSATVDVDAGESYVYEGDLITLGDTVVAKHPHLTRYHAAINDPEY